MIVLMHGVPETAALWDPLRAHLDPDALAVELPGFGCPRPDDFPATPDATVEPNRSTPQPLRSDGYVSER